MLRLPPRYLQRLLRYQQLRQLGRRRTGDGDRSPDDKQSGPLRGLRLRWQLPRSFKFILFPPVSQINRKRVGCSDIHTPLKQKSIFRSGLIFQTAIPPRLFLRTSGPAYRPVRLGGVSTKLLVLMRKLRLLETLRSTH
jgi:hypothetical protein